MIIFNGPSWGAYLWRGLYSEGLIYGGKFALQNGLGHLALTVERQVKKLWISFFLSKRLWISFFQIKLCFTEPFLLCFILYLREISKYKLRRAYIRKERCNGGFFALRVWGLILGGAYFRNFTVLIGLILNRHFMRSNQERKIKQFEGIGKIKLLSHTFRDVLTLP